MTKWHVNPNTGNPGRCSVDWNNPKSRGCPHQLSQNEHFSTAAEASTFYSQKRESQFDLFEGATLSSASQPVDTFQQPHARASNLTEPQYLSKDIGEKSFWGRNGRKIGAAVVTTFAISAAGSLIFGGNQGTDADASGPTGDTGSYIYEEPEDSTPESNEVDTPRDYSIVEEDETENEVEAPSAEPRDYGAEVGSKLRETGEQLKEAVTPERVDKLKEAGESTKDFLGGIIDGVTGYGKTESIPVEVPESSKNSKSSSSTSARFQGKQLQPSKKEVLEAQATLKKLKVSSENDGAYYNRAEQFGRSFETGVVGRLEHRDLPDATFKNSAPQSRAVSGGFTDPYTGEYVEIVKGSSNDTNVDHIVPLHEVVQSEDPANPLTPQEKVAIANDFDNLQVVGASINKSKGDKDPGQWLPPNKALHQRYAIATINVKSKYGLTVDAVEHSALAQVLANRQ